MSLALPIMFATWKAASTSPDQALEQIKEEMSTKLAIPQPVPIPLLENSHITLGRAEIYKNTSEAQYYGVELCILTNKQTNKQTNIDLISL